MYMKKRNVVAGGFIALLPGALQAPASCCWENPAASERAIVNNRSNDREVKLDRQD
jgi:hypothetical protein